MKSNKKIPVVAAERTLKYQRNVFKKIICRLTTVLSSNLLWHIFRVVNNDIPWSFGSSVITSKKLALDPLEKDSNTTLAEVNIC